MAEPATRELVDALDQLDDDDYLNLIVGNLDSATGDKQLWTTLCHPDLVDRTAGCVEEIVEGLERYVAAKGVGPGHAKARQLTAARARLRQANARAGRQVAHYTRQEGDLLAYRLLIKQLTLAINGHRLACITANLAPEQHDLSLWAALEELRLPSGDPRQAAGPSLAEQVVSGRWAQQEAVASHG